MGAVQVAYGVLANAHVQLENYEEAATWARRSIQLHPDHLPAHLALIASLAQTERLQEAEKALGELQKLEPRLTLERIQQRFPLGQYQNRDAFLAGLRKAGVAE